jgi:hypothetical protein
MALDGKVVLRLRRPWRDGTRALCLEPSECLGKLAVIIPRPRINLPPAPTSSRPLSTRATPSLPTK